MKTNLIFISLLLANLLLGQSEILDHKLDSIRTKYDAVGMSVAIVKDGKIIYSKGFGKRDVNRNLPMEANSKYRIASISKKITATALMKLYEDGKFKFNDDISNYLGFELRHPSYPNQIITIESILSHTAGLRDGNTYSNFLNKSYSSNSVPSIEELVVPGKSFYSSSNWSSNKAPNQKYFQYANINFGIAATLIEKLSEKRFDVYCKEVIFDRMSINASFNVADLNDINELAVLYRKSGSTWNAQFDNYSGQKPSPRDLSTYKIGTNGFVFAPQGGLRASAEDLAKLVIMFNNEGVFNEQQILNDTTITKMQDIRWTYSGSNGNNYYNIFNTYAIGNHTTNDLLPGENLIGHPGEAYGLISDMYYSREKNYGIIFLTNGGQWGYGNYSGWYNIEEDVFNICFESLDKILVSVSDDGASLQDFNLNQNYPNPFNPSTIINYYLPQSSYVKLDIYDILGSHVKNLFSGIDSQGTKEILWNGFTAKGEKAKTGIYVCRIIAKTEAQIFSDSKRMLLLK